MMQELFVLTVTRLAEHIAASNYLLRLRLNFPAVFYWAEISGRLRFQIDAFDSNCSNFGRGSVFRSPDFQPRWFSVIAWRRQVSPNPSETGIP